MTRGVVWGAGSCVLWAELKELKVHPLEKRRLWGPRVLQKERESTLILCAPQGRGGARVCHREAGTSQRVRSTVWSFELFRYAMAGRGSLSLELGGLLSQLE